MLDLIIRCESDVVPFLHAFDLAADCAAAFVDDEFGAGFSAVIAVVTSDSVKLAWAGHTSALLTRNAIVIERACVRTLAAELGRAGTITQEQVATHRFHRITTNGISGNKPPDFDITEWRINSGDRLYLGRYLNEFMPGEKINDAALVANHKYNVLLMVDAVRTEER